MRFTLIILISLTLVGLCASRRYNIDSFDIEKVLSNARTFNKLMDCIKPRNNCNHQEKTYINDMVDALVTRCNGCNSREKSYYDGALRMIRNRPLQLVKVFAIVRRYRPELLRYLG